jgi:hypothetical protein
MWKSERGQLFTYRPILEPTIIITFVTHAKTLRFHTCLGQEIVFKNYTKFISDHICILSENILLHVENLEACEMELW